MPVEQFGPPVPVGNPLVAVQADDRVLGGADDCGEPRLIGLGAAALGDVADMPGKHGRLGDELGDGEFDGEFGAVAAHCREFDALIQDMDVAGRD